MPIPGDLGCTCYRLRQTARLVSRTYDRFLAPAGISIGQFGILATLVAMQGQSTSALAEALQMERTTLTRNLSPLEKLGYIHSAEGEDRRSRVHHLTQAGLQALRAAKPLWLAAQQDLEHRLGKREVGILNKTLDNALTRLPAS